MRDLLKPGVRRIRISVLSVMVAAALILAGGQSASSKSTAEGAVAKSTIATPSTHCPIGTALGATSKQITVAATIVDISSGNLHNSTVGMPSSQIQESDWSLVAHNINKTGGAGCRKIVMSFYNVNPIDPAGAQQVCLNIAAAHPYIVVDSGALSAIGAENCIPAHKIPFAGGVSQADLTQYYPYDLQIGDIPSDGARTGILGLQNLGYFSSSKGFKKLGLLYRNCTPAYVAAQQSALSAAGVRASEIDSYDLGCPTGNDTPAALEQAVLSFKSAGVTDVTEVGVEDFGAFTQVAQQQKFKPRYILNDAAIAATAAVKTGADAANPSNFNGAVNVIGGGYGEESTPGYKPSGGTEKCDEIFKAAGQPSVYKQPDGYGGFACDYLWFVQALLNHAEKLQTSTLASDMHSIGTLDFSYGAGPVDFSAAPAGQPYGVSFWRPIYFHQACACWEVPDPTFQPPFK